MSEMKVVTQTNNKDVSCRVVASWFEELEARDMPTRLLEEWTGYPLDHLQDVSNWIAWEGYHRLMTEAATFMSDKDFEERGAAYTNSRWARPFTLIARLLFSGTDLFFWLGGPRGPNQFLFKCLKTEMVEVEPRVLTLSFGTKEGYGPPPRGLLFVNKGSLTTLPRIVGLPDAAVTLTINEDGSAFYRVEVPEGGGQLARIRRGLLRPFMARAAAHELQEAYEQLQGQFQKLEEEIEYRRKIEAVLEEKQAKLIATNQELERFAYIVSHDLKAPLRGIRNLTMWLTEELEPVLTEDSEEYLTLLEKRVERMEALIAGILAFSRSGRMKMQIETVAMTSFVKDVLMSLAIPEGFTIEIEPDMPTLTTDVLRLEQVLANLISNGIKYNDKEVGRVVISGEERGDFCVLAVSDNGVGIAAEHHEKVFEIFETLQGVDTADSTGVGLAIVKKIIEDVGGKIEVESEVGVGTVMRVWWPKEIGEAKQAGG
ncbi:MAG TPA: ATP-binding protein [Anaerolineae bacterium]|nr:ATP-binding protein [Anaerolineae bacterium]